MARRRGAPDLRRRAARREPKRRFVLICEGANTEPQYFRALRRTCIEALIEIEAVPGIGVPYSVAQHAVERAQSLGLNRKRKKGLSSFEEKDEVWAVFDRDSHPSRLLNLGLG